jgi:hypothetical protein
MLTEKLAPRFHKQKPHDSSRSVGEQITEWFNENSELDAVADADIVTAGFLGIFCL